MYLTVDIRLIATSAQAESLARTAVAFAAACDHVSGYAFEHKLFGRFALQKAVYRDVREKFGLSAQTACLVVARVAAAYKRERGVRHEFRRPTATYDDRVLAVDLPARTVSVWTVDGRLKGVPFVCGARQARQLEGERGEADLVCRDGRWYLLVTVTAPEKPLRPATDYLGVDLGVYTLAADSDGVRHSGKAVKSVRHRHRRLRRKLQKKNTKSALRRLRLLAGKEGRFATHVNHVLSKKLVSVAERTGRGIALEDLRGIRGRIRASRATRAQLHSWAFAQLRSFIAYKAALAGVPVAVVDPANTSRACAACGHCEKANRRGREFLCRSCGFTADPDTNAAENIRRAAVNRPNAWNGSAVAG